MVVEPISIWSQADLGQFFAWDRTRNVLRTLRPPRSTTSNSRLFVSASQSAVYEVYQNYPEVMIQRYDIGCADGCDGKTCVNNTYCECDASATGPDCSIPCGHCQHGTCYPTKQNAMPSLCDCDQDWAGANCEVSFPCRGHVIPQPSNSTTPFRCDCLFPNNKAPMCVSCPYCPNGVCDSASLKCICTPEFTGDRCEIDLAAPEMKVLDCSNATVNGTSVKDFDGYGWCNYTNLGIMPLRLPPPQDANSTAIGPPRCPSNATATDFCAVVTAVSTMGWVVPDPKATTQNSPNSFVIAGFADGQFVIADFLNESVRASHHVCIFFPSRF
jgi:hypothetical protein